MAPSAGVTESGLTIKDLENSDLTYEKKHELNIGADLGFLDNRINLTVDWYKRDNFDPDRSGDDAGYRRSDPKCRNVATMKSRGIEFSLSTKNTSRRRFQLDHRFHLFAHEERGDQVQYFHRAFNLVSGIGFSRGEGYRWSLFSDFGG